MPTDQGKHEDILAIKVHQWLRDWNQVAFDPKQHREKPLPHFYLFTLPAAQLRSLCGIYRRTTIGGLPRAQDPGIQRRHEPARSQEIRKYVRFGYPYSELSPSKQESGQFSDLRKPGWLPTAIVVNILRPVDTRQEVAVAQQDVVEVIDRDEGTAIIRLPAGCSQPPWSPTGCSPIEVIDGQHRLWAFEDGQPDGRFELPVVAFHGLDISWQAYLFWTINIKPKRINASLAFDLYPLLRTEDWLEKFEGHSVYRETRAQELVEALWSHPDSPWNHRINMLGDPGQATVSQAAWIRSLMASFVKKWEGHGIKVGGLFGATLDEAGVVLDWTGAQQAAFLIFAWQTIRAAVETCDSEWARSLRCSAPSKLPGVVEDLDLAFTSTHSLLNTDQGVRGVMSVVNDLCFARAGQLELRRWRLEGDIRATDTKAVSDGIDSLSREPAARFLTSVARALTKYDWRTSSASDLDESERRVKMAFRGSGGYVLLRQDLLQVLKNEPGEVGTAATDVLRRLKLGA